MIEGVLLIKLEKNSDSRGWLEECFRIDELKKEHHPAMAYVSMTLPGVERGPHEHLDQTDYFCFFSSRFRVHLWDNRTDSNTYGQEFTGEFGEDNPVGLIVPPKIIHGYRNIGTTGGLVLNFPNRLYRGFQKQDNVDEIRHEDLLPRRII